MTNTKPIPVAATHKNHDQFLDLAKELTVEQYNKLLPTAETIMSERQQTRAEANRWLKENRITTDDVYVVWFSKTLQNWKALVSTDVPDDHLYFELTHNGDKKETYVDVYDKIHNTTINNINKENN